MLKFLKIIVYIIAFLINIATRIAKVKSNRIVFISYLMNKPEGNFKLIANELTDFNVIFLLKKYDKTNIGKARYLLSMLKQAYYFNTAKIIVLDANCIVMKAVIKKKQVFVLQIWHASGALKKFGNDTKDRLYSVTSCDYGIVSSSKTSKIYSHALNIPEDKIMALGSPRTDSLFDCGQIEANKKRIYKKYVIEADRKLLLFAPTFRGKGVDDISSAILDVHKLSKDVNDNFVLAVRSHPMIRKNVDFDGIIDLSDEDLIEVLSAADILITDYSSIIFEYSILKRPMIFYTPDLDDYCNKRGFYVDYRSFVPGPIAKTPKQLVSTIKNLDHKEEQTEKIREEYFQYHDGRATKRVVALIRLLSEEKCNRGVSATEYVHMIHEQLDVTTSATPL